MNAVAKLLSTDGFIQVNKTLIKKVGLHEAILIGELCAEYNYWEERDMLDDGYFYSTRDNIEENTGLSEHYQRKALSTLYELGIILIEKRGLPAKNYYKINFDVLLSVIEESSCQRRRQQDTESVNLNNNKQTKSKKEKVVSKDTTTEFQFGSKQSKPKKENLYTKCVATIQAFTTNDTLRDYLKTFLDLRLEIARDEGKSFYFGMWTHLLSELKQLAFKNNKLDEELACEIVLKSTSRGWKHFYEITDNGFVKNYDVKNKPWEQGLCSDGYTEDEKREIDRLTAEREARGEQVWY